MLSEFPDIKIEIEEIVAQREATRLKEQLVDQIFDDKVAKEEQQ